MGVTVSPPLRYQPFPSIVTTVDFFNGIRT
jgi:hypothetical protein